jgi:photosystem II stability/assembly factor-like uncharacterized protein
MKYCYGIACLLLCFFMPRNSLHAQKYYDLLAGVQPGAPFSEVSNIVNRYYDTASTEKGSGYKQWKRYEWWAKRHLNETGEYADWQQRLKKEIRNYTPPVNTGGDEVNTPSTHGLWSAYGPTAISGGIDNLGRVVCMAFHPTITATWFIGTPAGGLWKTTDNGASYVPLTDHFPGLGIASIVINPNTPNTMYVLTGDGNASHRGHYLREHGTGIYKSTDGGNTWAETAFLQDYSLATYGYKMMMHPNNTNTLLAATSTGFWRSFDGGNSWAQSASLAGTEITDFEFKPGSASLMYACGYSGNFYRSTDTGRTWSTVSIGASGANRMEIAVTPDNVNRVYVLAGPDLGVGSFKGLFTSNNSGVSGSWSTIRTTPNILGYSSTGNDDVSQTWRNISLYISPADENFMITGGCFIWKSTNGGSTIAWSSGSIHADNHFIVKHPLNSEIYSGCDGGLFRSTDNGTSWVDINDGLQITQFYRFDMSATNSGRLIAGAQDNSQMLRNGTFAFNVVTCCDGMDNAMDYTNDNIMYACTQNGALSKSTDGINFSAPITQPTAGGDYWVTNINIHTTTNTTLFFGGNPNIYRSTNSGSSWTNIGSSGQDYMAQGTSNPDRMYAADGLAIQLSSNVNAAIPTWSTISGGANYPTGANMFITGMAVNPDNSFEMWITCSGYNGGQKVYRTTDGGANWQNMSGSLPNIPVHCIVFEDNNSAPAGALYIGTEMGVFYRDNTMGNWVPYGNYLPNSPVTDLKIFYGATRYLYASTFGRGIWRTTTYTGCQATYNITWTLEGYKYYEVSDVITSTSTLSGGNGTEAYFKAGNYVQMNPGFQANASSGFFKAYIGPCGSGGIPANRVATEILNISDAKKYFAQELDYKPVIEGETKINPLAEGGYQVNFVLSSPSKVHVYFRNETGERMAFFVDHILKPGTYKMNIPTVRPNQKIWLGVEAGGKRVETAIQ